MNIELKTPILQDMLAKSTMCVTNNKLLPVTSLIDFVVKDNNLTLVTSDGANYLYVKYPEKIDCEDIEFSVLAETFVKLVQKTTVEKVTLSLDETILTMKGNGSYKFELPLDENGALIAFAKHDVSESNFGSVLKRSVIAKILNFNKSSLASDLSFPALTNYYCGDSVVTSDSTKICNTGIKLFDSPMLVSQQGMAILNVMSNEDITYHLDNDEVIFESENEVLVTPVVGGIETFPIDAINSLVTSEFKSECKVAKSALLDVLDRISLFVTSYDNKAVKLTFSKDGLMVSSKKSNGVEIVPYVESTDFVEYTCDIDFEMLKSQLATQTTETIDLFYGSDIAIKLVDGNVTQIVALLDMED